MQSDGYNNLDCAVKALMIQLCEEPRSKKSTVLFTCGPRGQIPEVPQVPLDVPVTASICLTLCSNARKYAHIMTFTSSLPMLTSLPLPLAQQ